MSPRQKLNRTAGSSKFGGLAVLFLFGVLGGGCTDAFLQPQSKDLTNVDDRLTLKGRVCTAPPDPTGFPVKVVVVMDESGSMCVSDPPGSQEGSGFCEQTAVQAIIPPGVTEPARVRAIRQLVAQFEAQPNVQLAIVPFENNVKNVWPPAASGQRFAKPSGLDAYIGGLQNQLGKGTDYQGALSYAYSLISTDITQTEQNNPELLPRTRYVVVFLSDGTPYPRCSAIDPDATTGISPITYADPDHPELTWADSESAKNFCNVFNPQSPDQITGFVKGTDRNQNYQLFSYVDQLMNLKNQHNVGDIRLHSVLLFNKAAVAACGSICTDLYGTYVGVTQANYPAAAEKIARWTLQQFAERGNGVFQEFSNSDIQSLGLGALDYSSLASRNVMKTMLLQSMSSVPGVTTRDIDSDGDGLPDSVDNSFSGGTNGFVADSDGDCFDDNFETLHKREGFVAANDKDTRGCDPASPLTPGCACRDTDGDGLSQYAEAYLSSRTKLVATSAIMDSDGDGIPDGLEARYGLDPVSSNNNLDTDGDGIPDVDEVRAGSNPVSRDKSFYDREAFAYDAKADVKGDGSVCYDFSVSNIGLVTPPQRSGRLAGYNLFKLYFAEAPESAVSTDYGVWRTACAWAQYVPPSIRVPIGPELLLSQKDFIAPSQMLSDSDYATKCVGQAP